MKPIPPQLRQQSISSNWMLIVITDMLPSIPLEEPIALVIDQSRKIMITALDMLPVGQSYVQI